MVALSLRKPNCQKIDSSGLRCMAGLLAWRLALRGGRVSRVTSGARDDEAEQAGQQPLPMRRRRRSRSRPARRPCAAAGCRRTTAPAAGDERPAHRPPQAAEEQRAERSRQPPAPAPASAASFIVILLLVAHRLSSLATQCHALRQPSVSPATSSASVQECAPGWRPSSHSPSAAPSSVGTATDQPISPIMPRPNQTPCAALRRALSLRAAFAPTCPAKLGSRSRAACPGGSSFMAERREAAQETGFQLRHHRAHALLVLVQGQELALHRLAQPAEVGPAASRGAPRRARRGRP